MNGFCEVWVLFCVFTFESRISKIRFHKNLKFLTRYVTVLRKETLFHEFKWYIFISLLPRPFIVDGNSSFLVSDSVRFRPTTEIQLFL